METTTPFDLNQAIQAWCKTLAQSPAFCGDNLHELELHLRDSVTALQTKGLSAEESFLIAAKRLGPSHTLAKEFGKMNQKSVWFDRVLWMLIGIQVWGLTSSFITAFAQNSLFLGWNKINYNWRESGMTLPVTLFALVQVAAVVASVWFCWWLIVRKGAKVGGWIGRRLQRRSAFIAICIAFCVVILLVNVLTYFWTPLLFHYYGPEKIQASMTYSAYSRAIISPLQAAAMIVATLLLVRKRLRPSQA